MQGRPSFTLFALWRLLAALLVMLYHFCEFGPDAYVTFARDLERLAPLLDMFFIVSGFLIWIHYVDRLTDWASFRDFIIRRISRIYPLHLVTLSFFCVVGLAVHFGLATTGDPSRFTLPELVKELLLINAWGTGDILAFNYVSWSLSAEWFAYLAFPLLVLIHRRMGLIGLIFTLLATVVFLEGATTLGLMPFPTWLEANTWGAYRVLADFVLGAILAESTLRAPVAMHTYFAPWLVFGLAIALMLSGISSGYLSIAVLAFSIYLAGCADIARHKTGPLARLLMPVANMSFGIYLWHPVLGLLVLGGIWMRLLNATQAIPFWIMILIAMIGCIIVATLSALFLESPLREAILRITGTRRRSKDNHLPSMPRSARSQIPAE